MAYSMQQVTSDGTLTTIPVSFEFETRDTVKVFVGGFEVTTGWSWASPTINTIIFDTPVANGVLVIVRRLSDLSTVDHIFGYRGDGSGNAAFNADSMDDNFEQTMWAAQEVQDSNELTETSAAVAKAQADIATAAAAAAAASELAAEQSAVNSQASADSILDAEANSATSAAAALVSQNAAAASQAAASTSASNANTSKVASEAASVTAIAAATAANSDSASATASAGASSASATAAASSAGSALSSESAAASSAAAASASEGLAEDWATKLGTTVDGVEFSAKHYAELAAAGMGLPVYAVAPTSNVGPIYILGEGPAEWDTLTSTYIAKGGGATGGGSDKIFYKNEQTITQDYTIAVDENAVTTGPIVVLSDVVVAGNWVVL